MSSFMTYLGVFLLGGNVYCIIELLYRARTHYSMFFCAGFAVLILYYIFIKSNINPFMFALFGAIIITALELIFGIIFNLVLDMKVWDYSAVPLNFLGQICLPFSAIWYTFSLVLYYVFKVTGRA